MVFENGESDGRGFAKDCDFEKASVDGVSQVGYLFKLGGSISIKS